MAAVHHASSQAVVSYVPTHQRYILLAGDDRPRSERDLLKEIAINSARKQRARSLSEKLSFADDADDSSSGNQEPIIRFHRDEEYLASFQPSVIQETFASIETLISAHDRF